MDIKYTPTALDGLRSLMYARDRVLEEKYNTDYIKKKYGNKIQYRPGPIVYPCPKDLKGPCGGGNIHIIDKDLCLSEGDVPYGPDGNILPHCPTGCTGSTGCTGADPSCVNKPYLEWSTSEIACKYDSSGNIIDCDNGPAKGKCIFGDPFLKRWCEIPSSRRPKSLKGVTDVPPFKYDAEKGTCLETKPYCDWMGVSFHKDYQYPSILPTCYVSKGQKFTEDFITGKTIFRGIKKVTESFQETMKNIPQKVVKLCDEKYIKKKTKIGKDFAGSGVHLYLIDWNEDACLFDDCIGETVGFVSSELKKKFKGTLRRKTVGNKKATVYTVNRSDCNSDKNLKRLFLVGTAGDWVKDNLITLLHGQKS